MVSNILKRAAFSLIEMSLGLMILAIIISMTFIIGKESIDQAKGRSNQQNLESIAAACRSYYQKEGHWPSQVSDLQPMFLSSSFISQDFILTAQMNTLKVSNSTNTLTVVKPRGMLARLDYQ